MSVRASGSRAAATMTSSDDEETFGESVSRAPERQKHEVVPDEISLLRKPRSVFEVKRNLARVPREKFFRGDKVARRHASRGANARSHAKATRHRDHATASPLARYSGRGQGEGSARLM
jgi:hypothetical protein